MKKKTLNLFVKRHTDCGQYVLGTMYCCNQYLCDTVEKPDKEGLILPSGIYGVRYREVWRTYGRGFGKFLSSDLYLSGQGNITTMLTPYPTPTWLHQGINLTFFKQRENGTVEKFCFTEIAFQTVVEIVRSYKVDLHVYDIGESNSASETMGLTDSSILASESDASRFFAGQYIKHDFQGYLPSIKFE